MEIVDIKRLNSIKYAQLRFIQKSEHNLFVTIIFVFIKAIISIFSFQRGKTVFKDIHVLALTINNKKSVKGILDNLPRDSYSIWSDKQNDVPNSIIYLKSFFYLPKLVRFYVQSDSRERIIIRQYGLDFFRTCALYCEIDKIIKKNPHLKMILFPNDHTLTSRCFIECAKKNNIRSLYVQHASVSDVFPSLSFTYAFLDGKQSYDIYNKIGNIQSRIYLTGSPRFDSFFDTNKSEKTYDVGIALNSLDNINRVLNLCLFIKDHYSHKILVRPHTGMIKEFNGDLFKEHGFEISNPLIELSNVFLSKVKIMIANESGIHLDAALLRVPSILYNFSDRHIIDWYSYVKNGMIQESHTKEELISRMKKGVEINNDAVRYYCASFGSSFEGKVGPFIATFISKNVYESEDASQLYVDTYMSNGGGFFFYKEV